MCMLGMANAHYSISCLLYQKFDSNFANKSSKLTSSNIRKITIEFRIHLNPIHGLLPF